MPQAELQAYLKHLSAQIAEERQRINTLHARLEAISQRLEHTALPELHKTHRHATALKQQAEAALAQHTLTLQRLLKKLPKHT